MLDLVKHNMKYLFTHGHLIIDGNKEYLDGALLVDGEKIEEVFPQSSKVKDGYEDYKRIDLKGMVVMPGFFDTHTHGIDGMSFDDADDKSMDKIAYEFARDGVTSYLATLSYDLSVEQLNERLSQLDKYQDSSSRFCGIHIEGPYLSKKHLGVGSPDKFKEPDLDAIKTFTSITDRIKQMTIAYELDGAKKIGEYLHSKNIKVMCGHSDALLEDLDENVDGFTHLFNAMRSLHHRDMTLVNCAFMNKWYCELIADGNHVKDNVLSLVLRNIDRDKIMLVTDSSIARNLPDGEYEFISKPCTKKGTEFITHDGHYAGSVVGIHDELRVLKKLGAKYTDLLLYSSLNAFRFYGLDKRFGSLVKGKCSDIVIMNDDFEIQNVLLRGELLYV